MAKNGSTSKDSKESEFKAPASKRGKFDSAAEPQDSQSSKQVKPVSNAEELIKQLHEQHSSFHNNSSSSVNVEEEEEGEEGLKIGDTITVDFDIHSLQEEDRSGVDKLLNTLFWKDLFTSSEFTELILKQWDCVGSAIKIEGSSEVYGFISVVNLHHHIKESFIKRFCEYLTKKTAVNGEESNKVIKDLLDNPSKGLGVIFNERVMNVPPQIAPDLLGILFSEIDACVQDKEPYDFDNYIYLSKTFMETVPEELKISNTSVTETDKDDKINNNNSTEQHGRLEYVNDEDLVVMKHCSHVFTFTVEYTKAHKDKAALGDRYIQMKRSVGVIPKKNIKPMLEEVKNFISKI